MKQSPAKIVYRDELVTAFHDKHPISATHVLIIPNKHITSVNELEEADALLMGRMVLVAKKVAAALGVSERGYRLIMNTGPDSGQTVLHLHLHLIAGKFTRFRLG